MKLAILGATGPSGQEVVKQALEAGHEVVAVVRNPDKLQIKHDNLKVEIGDIFSGDSLASHFSGCDAVLSCLGAPLSFFSSITLLQDSCKMIVAALRKAGVKKFIPMSSQNTRGDENLPFVAKWIFKPLFIKQHLIDMSHMEEYLVKECQDIDFVVVKPPGLFKGPIEDGPISAEEGDTVNGRVKHWITRAKVAQFLLQQVTGDEWNKKLVSIAVPE